MKKQQVWFIADTHFGDKMIMLCYRPQLLSKKENEEQDVSVSSAKKMDEMLIRQWNKVVGPNDIVWHLGDFGYANHPQKGKAIFKRLNGKINLVMGNHDILPIETYYSWGFNRVYDKPVILDDWWVLSHEPHLVRYPHANIYGHVHGDDHYQTYTKLTACVCVEKHKYTPVNFMKIKQMLKERNRS